jgi:hypothetical protein
MYATATQIRTDHVYQQITPVRTARQTVPNPTVERIAATFTEQHGAGRWEEATETPDFPLDFQI